MHSFWQDLRFAVRGLGKEPGFVALAVLTLAVGVGANTAMFSTLSAVLIAPLPYDEPDRLVIANTTFEGYVNWTSSAQDYEDYRKQNGSFESLALMAGFPMSLAATGGAEPEMVDAHWVSWDLFPTLRVSPDLGREFREEEARLGADQSALISHAYWQARFGGGADAIGSAILLDGTPATIVGVMPADFHFYYDTDVWLPYRLDGPFAGGRQYHNWVPIGRLAPGVTLQRAQSEFDTISARLQAQYPDTNKDKAMQLTGLHESITGSARPSALMLSAAVALLLLIACANVANLLLARSSSRQSEMALRSALGAGRPRLVRQLLTESGVIAALACAVGICLALWLQRIVAQVVVVPALGQTELGLSWSMLGLAVGAAIFTSLLFGGIPALQTAPREISRQLASGARSGMRGHTRWPGGLVVAQVALSLVLLVGAGLLVRSFSSLVATDNGFDPTQLLTAELRLPPDEYDEERRAQFFTRLGETAEALPGVSGVALINQLPVRDPGNNIYIYDTRNPPADISISRTAYSRIALPGYFETMGIPLLAGRSIQDTDTAESPPVMVINQTMAQTLFPGEAAVGQRVTIAGDPPRTFEVVGVVGDVRMNGPAGGPLIGMYRPYAQSRQAIMRVAIRSVTDPMAVAAPLRRVIHELDPNLPVGDLQTMEAVIANSGTVVRSRVAARSLGLFAAIALLLASVGLYGVLACFVAQRKHEIGVRMALGDDGRGVTGQILKRGLGLVAVGLALGSATALLGSRLLADLLFEVERTDPRTYLGAAGIFLVVAVLACLIPAWRALRVDPLKTLRAE